jgi:hypothetical protein
MNIMLLIASAGREAIGTIAASQVINGDKQPKLYAALIPFWVENKSAERMYTT